MALITKKGYGQVEPNRLAAQKTGEIIADVPVMAATMATLGGTLQNGMFLTLDPGAAMANNLQSGAFGLPTEGGDQLTGLVYNEVKLYAEWHTVKDFALHSVEQSNFTPANYVQMPYHPADGSAAVSTVFPRVYRLHAGDTFTINLFDDAIVEGGLATPGAAGHLVSAADATGNIVLQAVKATTMPDGQPGMRFQVIKA